MPVKKPLLYNRFDGGLGDFARSSSLPNSFAFAQSVDIRSDPNNIAVLPRTIKESGSTVVDLIKWAETYDPTTVTYMIGDQGNFYSRSTTRNYTLLRTIANNHGNGLVYSAEDDNMWYANDSTIGKYGPLASSSPTFIDDYFGSIGGVPLNTNSLDLEASSSQYASSADTVPLSITGDLAFDFQIKPESFPTVNNSMTIVSKWNESGATRSYRFDVATVAGYFGNGTNGALTISSNTTESPIDSACTGTIATNTLSATNASFASGQVILIHQTRGTNAGQWQRTSIDSYTTGVITTVDALNGTYTAGAQVRVIPQYTNVTIDAGFTYTAKAWNGTVGGILAFIASGTVTVNGTISASQRGFTATDTTRSGNNYKQGDGSAGAGNFSYVANGNGGGGGDGEHGSQTWTGGGGGGHAFAGQNGTSRNGGATVSGGASAGSSDLTTMVFGGAGGVYENAGGAGGGAIFLSGVTFTMGATGSVVSSGGNSTAAVFGSSSPGAGAGGSILIKAQTATLGTTQISASGGTAGAGIYGTPGGNGSVGRMHLDYYTSYTGTVGTGSFTATQDGTLVSNTGQMLRLSLSSNGSNSEVLSMPINLTLGTWQQVGVSWDASASTAEFMLNASSLGTRTGTFTSINNNASRFAIGAHYDGAGSATAFWDGLIDEGRVFSATVSAGAMQSGLSSQIPTNIAGLVGYYKFNNDYTDATVNANTLTATGSPTFSSNVPFSSATTRADIDQSRTGGATTYAIPTTISEASADKLLFTPTRDPQKSIQFNVGNIGTGTWVVTIHDSNNTVMATATVANADMHTGNYEFTFASTWSPLTNFTNEYHAHITVSSGSPTVVSATTNNLNTADFVTYFQFLVTDTAWHPMERFLNFWVVGNGRYLGKYEAPLYNPNHLVMGAGWRVRCLANWHEYKAIGMQKQGEIQNSDSGRIYFWDGYSDFANFFVDVPEGGINALCSARGKLYVWAGYKNQLFEYTGGDSLRKLKEMPYMESNRYIEVLPGAVTMWESYLRFGTGDGNSEEVRKGVYTWGAKTSAYPEILTYDYPASTQIYSGSQVSIGMLHVVGQELLMSWRTGTAYGVDYVSADNPPASFAAMFLPIDDYGNVTHEKESQELVANFSPLREGESILLGYAYNESYTYNFESIVTNPDTTEEGDTESRMVISNSRYNEAQATVQIFSDTTSPIIKGITFMRDGLDTEQRP